MMPVPTNRTFGLLVIAALSALAVAACGGGSSPERRAEPRMLVGPACGPDARAIAAAPRSGIYHGAMPSLLDADARDGARSAARVRGFERLAERRLAWVYFSDNWFHGISFPGAAVESVRRAGAMPFIRLMPRSSWRERRADPTYRLDRIARGDFDAALRRWARAARATRLPMLVDFAPEMNGDWFPWSGRWNGGSATGRGDPKAADGPETYRDAYRHIVDLFRAEGAGNVGFAFHANARSGPDEPWNAMSAYYPGDAYIDWIGVSAYGSVFPGFDWEPLSSALDEAYPQLAALSPTKPIAIMETGVVEDPSKGRKADWIRDAYDALESGRYPRVKAAIWWQERWRNADGRISDVRIDSGAAATRAYRKAVSGPGIVARPQYRCAPAA
jgi:hypothetical protein